MVALVYLWRLWFVILNIVLVLILGPWVYLFSFRKGHYKICYFFIRLWALGVFYGMGFRYELIKKTSKSLNSNRQYIVIANHTSVIDVMLMVILLPNHPICFVGKKELVKIPIFGTIYKRVAVMVDRNSPKSRAEVYTRSAERMRSGQNMVIFPEGGVPDDTSIILDDFKNGAFSLAVEHSMPLAIFTFIGLKEMFPFDNSKGYPGKIKVFLNEIIDNPITYNVEELKVKAHQLIKNTLEENTL